MKIIPIIVALILVLVIAKLGYEHIKAEIIKPYKQQAQKELKKVEKNFKEQINKLYNENQNFKKEIKDKIEQINKLYDKNQQLRNTIVKYQNENQKLKTKLDQDKNSLKQLYD